MDIDFEKIAASVRIHFCPQCKASFGCQTDEDGDCDCIGRKYNWNWRKPWCPNCAEAERLSRCTCGGFFSGGDLHHHSTCPAYEQKEEE